MSDMLFTLAQRGRHQQVLRKSRFLAVAEAVRSGEQALTLLRELADPAASHNCWAYRIGQDYRFNDDGEPGGSAGRPILQAIESQAMDGVMVVVTRWYGGIKLGVGGLARAYGGTATACLRQAERVPIVPMARLALHAGFAELALLKARLKELDAEVESEQFQADGVQLCLRLPEARVAEIERLISDLTHGRSNAKRLD
ncbi:MAG: YigZ family protein [Rhodanobacter sp.]